jgi:hypothetical protein
VSPLDLRAYLDEMRAAGVTRGQLTVTSETAWSLQVELGPMPFAAGAEPVPAASPAEDLPDLAFDPLERAAFVKKTP